jgi:hypothetical protein
MLIADHISRIYLLFYLFCSENNCRGITYIIIRSFVRAEGAAVFAVASLSAEPKKYIPEKGFQQV